MITLFDGVTINPEIDNARLLSLQGRVESFMADCKWHTLAEIQRACGGTEASCSSRCRDLRKPRFGGYVVDRRRVSRGLFEYRMHPSPCFCDACMKPKEPALLPPAESKR